MALIACPDCGTEVSDLAPACPRCGRPATARAERPAPMSTAAEPVQSISVPRIIAGVLIALGAAVLWFVLSVSTGRSTPQVADPGPRPTAEPDLHALALGRILVKDFAWKTGGFGTVALVTITVVNANPFPVKDLKFRCEVHAKSGTGLGSLSHTVYDVVKADATRKLPEANMGLVDSQAASLSCAVIDFAKAP